MQLGFYFDQTRCIGCHGCEVACKDWNDIQDATVHWRRVATLEEGTYPSLFVAFLSLSCCHCAEPACAAACPVAAITKSDSTGIVSVAPEICLGRHACGVCRDACPYDVPQFGAAEDAKMQKCTFCPDRLEMGESPACVGACPVRALDAGPVAELEAKYGAAGDGAGFRHHPGLGPRLIVKPKRPLPG